MSPDCSIPGMAAYTLSLLPNKQHHPGYLYASTTIPQPPRSSLYFIVAKIHRRPPRIAAPSGSSLRTPEKPPVPFET